jgi:MerR family transcriptional regulator, copper efflux regulator
MSPKMVRHCEHLGLLPPAERTEAGYRQYTAADVELLAFIRRARALGFSTEQIGELLALRSNRGRASRRVKAVAAAHLVTLEAQLMELKAMKQALQHLLAACAGDDGPCCGILEGLSKEAGSALALRGLKPGRPAIAATRRPARPAAPSRS